MIFHDTNEFDNEFGVWEFWQEIADKYISFEFKHTHGLGIIALGNESTNPIVKLLQILGGNAKLAGAVFTVKR